LPAYDTTYCVHRVYIHSHRRLVDNYNGDVDEENRFVSRCLSGTLMEKVSSAESNFGLVTTIYQTHSHTLIHSHTSGCARILGFFLFFVAICWHSFPLVPRAAKNLFTLVCITASAVCVRVWISYQFAYRFWSP